MDRQIASVGADTQRAIQIACDESGSDGENLIEDPQESSLMEAQILIR